jgi:DNA-binding response OmpR family regulator
MATNTIATNAITIFIADDHPVTRMGLRDMLRAESSFAILGEANDGEYALEMVKRLRPDVLLLDVAMPQMSGLDVIRKLQPLYPSLSVILVTAAIDKQQLVSAFRLGARGVILKDTAANSIVEAIHSVSAGLYWIDYRCIGDLVEALHTPLATDGTPCAEAPPVESQPYAQAETISEKQITFADVVVNFRAMEVSRAGKSSAMTKKQGEMLKFLWRNSQRVLSRKELLSEVWTENDHQSTRVVDNVVLQLRHLMEPNPAEPVHFKTVYGMGYKFIR